MRQIDASVDVRIVGREHHLRHALAHEAFRAVVGGRRGVDDERARVVDVFLEREVGFLVLVFFGVAVAVADVDAREDTALCAGLGAEVLDALVDVRGVLGSEVEEAFVAGA